MKQIRLSLPDELHVMLEKILNPLAPSRVLVDEIKRINVHLDDATSEKLTELARQKGTNKNEVIIAILKAFNARVKQLKGISNSDIESLKNNATALIKTINDNNEFSHKVKLTKATLLAAILCTLAGTSDKIK